MRRSSKWFQMFDERRVGRDEATRDWNASYHLIAAASDMPPSELSETSSSMGRGRFLATPFGQEPNHPSGSSEKSSTSWICTSINTSSSVLEKYDPWSPDASVIRDWLLQCSSYRQKSPGQYSLKRYQRHSMRHHLQNTKKNMHSRQT